jgi:NAD(P)-dependent dehydrogenase (short-subunit alcohol dehydrogenase family)
MKNKVALITGAATGIGREAARLFCEEGASVAIADISASGEDLASELRSWGAKAIFVRTDVTDEASVNACTDAVMAEFGKLDVLYNNAGGSTSQDGMVTEVSVTEEFWRAIRLNLFGTWLCCRFAIPHIIRNGGGCVINTASTAGLMGLERLDAYTAAKGGVVSLTKSMAVEYAPHKVRVNAIAPTTTLTDRIVGLNKLRPTAHRSRNLLGAALPRDIAQAALFLAGDESLRVTGHILAVDSGLTVT